VHAEPNTSALIPLWVERGLYPGREASRLGLQMGFMPHTLQRFAAAGAVDDEGSSVVPEGQLLEAMSEVHPELLLRSEFVLPADDATRDMHARLLQGL
jgi:hypothetical protein